MTVNTQKLCQAAQACIAESGKSWYESGDLCAVESGYNLPVVDDDFIEAASPAAVSALLDENEALRAELQARQWMPIESCPRGQLALFYDANATEVRNCMFVDWMVDGEFCGNRHHEASHWMPLPPAPPQGDGA